MDKREGSQKLQAVKTSKQTPAERAMNEVAEALVAFMFLRRDPRTSQGQLEQAALRIRKANSWLERVDPSSPVAK